jgi:hypothetical protein
VRMALHSKSRLGPFGSIAILKWIRGSPLADISNRALGMSKDWRAEVVLQLANFVSSQEQSLMKVPRQEIGSEESRARCLTFWAHLMIPCGLHLGAYFFSNTIFACLQVL